MKDSLEDHLTAYLRDAHSIEVQALQQLKKAPDHAGNEAFAQALRRHHRETEDHEERVRGLLEKRGSSPSSLKDRVMQAGGEGFVLFARVQTDTPGKLASHALSYEALEWASYDLLARTAERMGEKEVARVARSIREEERAMMERIEGLLDQTARSALESASSDDLRKHLERYLADAHAIEAQSIQLLEAGQKMVDGYFEEVFREHLIESRKQQEVIEHHMDEMGADRSFLKDAAMRVGALNWGMFFGAQPDTPGKLGAFAYAFEHLEIGGYLQLRTVAEMAAEAELVRSVNEILTGERRAATIIGENLGKVVERSLELQQS